MADGAPKHPTASNSICQEESLPVTTHSLACQRAIAEFADAPRDSVPFLLAHYIEEHEAPDGLALLITVIDSDAPGTPEFIAAQKLLPAVIAEAVAR